MRWHARLICPANISEWNILEIRTVFMKNSCITIIGIVTKGLPVCISNLTEVLLIV